MYAFTGATGKLGKITRFIRVTRLASITGGVRFASVVRIKRNP